MELGIEGAPHLLAPDRLERAGAGIAPEQEAALARQLARLHGAAVLELDQRPGSDIAAGLDHAIVAQRNTQTGIGADQAALADAHLLLAAAAQGAHQRGAAADVAAGADHDALADAALDHAGAERAGVVIAESLVHHHRALGEVSAQPNATGIGDAHAARHDVVGHARDLVDALHVERHAPDARPNPRLVEVVERAGAERGPRHRRDELEDIVEVDGVGPDLPQAQQMEAQVGVVHVDRRILQRGNVGTNRHDLDPAHVIDARIASGSALTGPRGRRLSSSGNEPCSGKPGVEHDAVARHGRIAFAGRAGCFAHEPSWQQYRRPEGPVSPHGNAHRYSLISTRRSAGWLRPSDGRGRLALSACSTAIAAAGTPAFSSAAFTGATFSGRPTSVTCDVLASSAIWRTADAAVGDSWPPFSVNTITSRCGAGTALASCVWAMALAAMRPPKRTAIPCRAIPLVSIELSPFQRAHGTRERRQKVRG